jgi:hypothetical protein
MKCKDCPYSSGGSRSALSDVCDGCTGSSNVYDSKESDRRFNRAIKGKDIHFVDSEEDEED